MTSVRCSTSSWYDADGNLIATSAPGGLWTKYTYDGAGRQTGQYITDGAGGAANAGTVAYDHVLTEQLTGYDQDGNVTSTTTLDRYDTVVLDGIGPTGALTSSDARISYVLNWYDAGGRPIESVNYGTNGGSAPAPSSAPSRAASNGWDPYLVTNYGYSDAGYMDDVTDPRNIQTKQFFDAMGRVEQTIQGYTGQTFDWGQAATANSQVTTYLYDGDGRVRFQNVRTVDSTGKQVSNTTEFQYRSGFAANSPVETIYYNPDTGTAPSRTGNVQIDNYDNLGNVTLQTDRSQTQHLYKYDAIGRLLSDNIWYYLPAGTGTQNISVRERSYQYDVLGRTVDAATFSIPFATTATPATSDVAFVYDGLGNLTDEFQSYAGTIQPGTSFTSNPQFVPDVHYYYDTNFDSNYSRMSAEVYPNGRVLTYNYNGNNGLDASISRLTSISDGNGAYVNQVLAKYTYLGLGTMVSETLPQENVELSYRTADAGSSAPTNPNTDPISYDAGPDDPYSGLDRFGRVIDQNWFYIGGGTVDRQQYVYDADGNILNDNNLGPTTLLLALSTQYGGYDALNRPTTFNGPWGAESFGTNSTGVYQHNASSVPPMFKACSLPTRWRS